MEPLRIAVVDDDTETRCSIADALSVECVVVGCDRLSELLARIRSGERFDAFLCEADLLDGDAVDTLAALQLEDADLARRVVFMTRGTSARISAVLSAMPNVLQKPFAMDAARNAAHAVVAQHGRGSRAPARV